MEKIKINGSLNMSKLKTFLKTWDIDLSSAFDTNFATKFYLDGNLEKLKISNFETNIARESFVIKANGEALNLKENPTVKLNLDINLKDGELSKKMNLNPPLPSRHIGYAYLKHNPLSLAAREFLKLINEG